MTSTLTPDGLNSLLAAPQRPEAEERLFAVWRHDPTASRWQRVGVFGSRASADAAAEKAAAELRQQAKSGAIVVLVLPVIDHRLLA